MNMIISQACKIAIKSLVLIASKSFIGEKVGIKLISKEIAENEHTIGKTLQVLVKHGLLSSVRGPQGGFYLTENQYNTNMYKIVETIDGNNIFKECILGLPECNNENPCPMHHSFEGLRVSLYQIFKDNTIRSLCEVLLNGKSILTYI